MGNLKFAVNSILKHKMRSFLTMLGIIIGVASVVIIMSLGNGMQKSVTASFTEGQDNIAIYFQTEKEANKAAAESDDLSVPQIITSQAAPKILTEWLPGLTSIYGVVGYYVTNIHVANLSNGSKQAEETKLMGVSSSYFDYNEIKIIAGRTLKYHDYRNFSRVIMLNEKTAQYLFPNPEAAINQTILVGDQNYLVVGVYQEKHSALATMTNEKAVILANTQLSAEYNVDENAQLYVHVEDVKNSTNIGKKAADYLTERAQVEDGLGKFTIVDIEKMLEKVEQVYTIMTSVIGSIAGISLLVGGIGVMNIMLVSVTERTREIGLRKALGATRFNILSQFLIEAIVLTVIGGSIGISFALGTIQLFNTMPNSAGMKAELTPNSLAISFVFSAVIGIIFGVLPANKASKLNPIQALRYE